MSAVMHTETHESRTEFSLGEVLSHRCRLLENEIPLLLADLPRLLDELEDPDCVASLLTETFVVFTTSVHSRDELLIGTMEHWPAFRLDLRVGEARGTRATEQGFSPFRRDLPTRFAGLIYELVGGKVSSQFRGKFQYRPVAGIGEETNLALQEMIAVGGYSDCKALWRNWLRKTAARARMQTVPDLYIPKWALKCGRPGMVMDLRPQHRRQPPIRFIARDDFRIGRSLTTADLPLGVRSVKEGNDNSKHLSRAHVMAQLTDAGVLFQDGDGSKGSENGTLMAEARLGPQKGRILDQTTELVLAPGICDCRLKVEPFPPPSGKPLSIANLQDWQGVPHDAAPHRPAPFAAIAFRAAGDTLLLREVAWIFTGIGLRVANSGALECGVEGMPEFFFLHAHGCFWLACLKEPAERVSADDAALAPGQIMPLDEQLLDFGQRQFICRVLPG